MLAPVRTRLRYGRRAFGAPLWLIIGSLWTAFGVLTAIRDEFLPPHVRAQWDTYRVLPHWPWETWALGFAVIALVASLEGGYRVAQRLAADVAALDAQLDTRAAWRDTRDTLGRLYVEGRALAFRVHDWKRLAEGERGAAAAEGERWQTTVEQFLADRFDGAEAARFRDTTGSTFRRTYDGDPYVVASNDLEAWLLRLKELIERPAPRGDQ